MHMFENFLSSIPKNRSDMVNDLEIPDVTLSPYIWEPEDSIARSESTLTTSTEEQDLGTISTDSSIPLSRAMTDSDIDYGRFRRVSFPYEDIYGPACKSCVSPYAWDLDYSYVPRRNSVLSPSVDDYLKRKYCSDPYCTLHSYYSLSSYPYSSYRNYPYYSWRRYPYYGLPSSPLIDWDIDCRRCWRYKNRCFSDPWKEMRTALDAFPSGHLDSLSSFQDSSPLIEPDLPRTKPGSTRDSIRRYNRELGRKMERYFDEECLVFHPDDPGLEVLQEAVSEVDMQKIIDSEWDSITP